MPVRYEKGDDGVVTLTLDAPGAPVNTMTKAWEEAFHAAVERLQKERDSIAGVILRSAKKTFFAGAELKDVLALTAKDGHRFFEELEAVKRDFRALERLGKPVVACLEGTELGAGVVAHQPHPVLSRLRVGSVRPDKFQMNLLTALRLSL